MNKRRLGIIPLLALMGGILWPVNCLACRILVVVSIICLFTISCVFLYEPCKRHKRITLCVFLAVALLVLIDYVLLGPSPFACQRTTEYLRHIYIEELKRYEGTRYVWGGENMLGMDCSGLPSKALRNALWAAAFRCLDRRYLRHAIKNWWMDASVAALTDGYEGYLTPLDLEGTIAEAPQEKLPPGALAVTEDGTYVMVFLEKGTWISADPLQGKVVIEKPSSSSSPWFNEKVRFYAWSVLLPYHDF